jgi:hypothetical protein
MKLNIKEIEVGFLYQTSDQQYRAVLAMKGDFLIYAPSITGSIALNLSNKQEKMPFENQPFKKCQIATFAKKDYQLFSVNDSQTHPAIKHALNDGHIDEIIRQCNAKAAMAAL